MVLVYLASYGEPAFLIQCISPHLRVEDPGAGFACNAFIKETLRGECGLINEQGNLGSPVPCTATLSR